MSSGEAWDPLSGGFLFMRHGRSEANAAGLVAGWLDSPLTDGGRAEARAVAVRLLGVGIDRIWSSDLSRAFETASIVGSIVGVTPSPLQALRERNWGPLEGAPLSSRPSRPTDEAPLGVEPWAEFSDRVLRAIDSLRLPPRTLIVAHSGVYRVLAERLLSLDPGLKAPGNAELYSFSKVGGRWTAAMPFPPENSP